MPNETAAVVLHRPLFDVAVYSCRTGQWTIFNGNQIAVCVHSLKWSAVLQLLIAPSLCIPSAGSLLIALCASGAVR